MKIKKGDNVKVLSGKDRNKTGKVIQVLVNKQTKKPFVVVEGLNVLKKHIRSQGKGQKGQVIELPAPMHASNVMVIDPKTSKPSRIGFAIEGKEKKRIAKKSKDFLD
jgi:large subunit ribosomal protein L24